MPTPPKSKMPQRSESTKPASAVDALGLSEFDNLADEILEFSEGLFESEDELMALTPASPSQKGISNKKPTLSPPALSPTPRTSQSSPSLAATPPLPKPPPLFSGAAKAPPLPTKAPSNPFGTSQHDPFAGLNKDPFANLNKDPFGAGGALSNDEEGESFLPKPNAASLNSPAPIPKDTMQVQALVSPPDRPMNSPSLFSDDDHDDPAETQREIQRPDFAKVAQRPGPKEVLHNPPDELWLPVEEERSKKSSIDRVFTVDDVPNMPSRGQRGGARPPQPPAAISGFGPSAVEDGGDSTMLSPHALQPTDFGRSSGGAFGQPPPFSHRHAADGDSTMIAPELVSEDDDDDGDSTMLAPHFLEEDDDGDSTMLAPHLVNADDAPSAPSPWEQSGNAWGAPPKAERPEAPARGNEWEGLQDSFPPEDLGPSYAGGYAHPPTASGSFAQSYSQSGSYAQPPQLRSGSYPQPPQLRSGSYPQPPQLQNNPYDAPSSSSSVSYGPSHGNALRSGAYDQPPPFSHAPETQIPPYQGASYGQSGSYAQPPSFSQPSAPYSRSGSYTQPPFVQSEPIEPPSMPSSAGSSSDMAYPPQLGPGSSPSHAQIASAGGFGYAHDGSGSHSYPAPQVGYGQDGSGSHSYPGQHNEGSYGHGAAPSLGGAPSAGVPVVGRGGSHVRGSVPVATSRSSASLGAVPTIDPFRPPVPSVDPLDTDALLAEAEEVARVGAGASRVGPAPTKKRRSGLLVLLILIVVTLGTIASALFAFRFWDNKVVVSRGPDPKQPGLTRLANNTPPKSRSNAPSLGMTTTVMDAGSPTEPPKAQEEPKKRIEQAPPLRQDEPKEDGPPTDPPVREPANEPDDGPEQPEERAPTARRAVSVRAAVRTRRRVAPRRRVEKRPVAPRKVVKVASTPAPATSSGLRISIQPACTLFEGGRNLGKTDKEIVLKRDPGTYNFLCKDQKKLLFYSFSVKVPSSGSATFQKTLRPGILHVHTRPWSMVYSKRFGKLGRSGGPIQVYEGTYRLLLYKRGTLIPGPGMQLQHRVTIRPGKTTRTPVLEFPAQDDEE
ncbi:MAG: hypothetical protein H6728_10995 [Myxococcales bacterium]|nr:hypothetical protein [Myxococcales bacterium]